MKLELEKTYKHLYQPSAKTVSLVEVPRLNFLMVNGTLEKGTRPGNSPTFLKCTEALYNLAYTLKFNSKLNPQNPIDFKVMALEGLWWIEEGEFDFNNPNNWVYTLMIMQPEHITQADLNAAIQQVVRKKGDSEPLRSIRLEQFEEGLCVQIMHIGPYDTEPETMEQMKRFATQHHYSVVHGKHHEIYIGNPLKAKPENLKTILRLPVIKNTQE